ncbi:hypothetical protein CRM22_008609 [Opisthorchis felineus]|uniref:Uncharacterized protein n=1 Tax=Opisthorchis felineus TaxID=147828 RepID=A0A4S2LCC6_OPIFE|nr:hypothetical protein CRM22_008609 [Opisthorchis felineus]
MSTEDLLVCVSSVDLLCSAPSRMPTCLAHASYVQKETQVSKILLAENESANTEFPPTLSSTLLHVKENSVLLPMINLQKPISGFRSVQVPCTTETPLHGYSPNAKTQKTNVGLVTEFEKRKSDWIVWKTTTISLFCVFFVFFVAVDFYYLLHPEIYVHNPVKLKLEFKNHKKLSRNNAVLPEAPCRSKKLHNVTRRAMTNRSVFQQNSPGHMKSNVFSSFDDLYSDKVEPSYLRPSESPYFMPTSSVRGKDVLILKHNQDVVLKESKTVTKQMQNLSFVLVSLSLSCFHSASYPVYNKNIMPSQDI